MSVSGTDIGRLVYKMLFWPDFKIFKNEDGSLIFKGGEYTFDASCFHPDEAFLEAYTFIEARLEMDRQKEYLERAKAPT